MLRGFTRKFKPLEILTKEQVHAIHKATLDVLSETGVYVKPSKLSVGQFLAEWLRDYVELNCSPRAKASYEMIICRHLIPELGSIPLSQLEPRHLRAFYSRQRERGRVDGKGQLSLCTVRYGHSLLAEALGYAVKVVSERLGHSSIRVTLDTYSHVIGGLQEAAAQRFDDLLTATSAENVGKMLANQFETDIGVAGFEPATT